MLKTLILLVVGNVAVSAMIAALVIFFAPWMSLLALYEGMAPSMQLLALVIVILTFVGARAGLTRNLDHVRKIAILATALGVLGGVLGELHTHFGWLIDNVINFETLALMRVTSLSMLWRGLFGALVTVGLFQLGGGGHRG